MTTEAMHMDPGWLNHAYRAVCVFVCILSVVDGIHAHTQMGVGGLGVLFHIEIHMQEQ